MSAAAVIVFGGYGTFGARVARQLARAGLSVTVAGRRRERAKRLAAALGSGHRGVAADLQQAVSCRTAVAGHRVAINCGGPFSEFDATLLTACLDAKCHYVDIADDRRYARLVHGYGERFSAASLTAAWGCSSLPGISGAVATVLRAEPAAAVSRARVTLFIGNRNPKGAAAVRSASRLIGRPIEAPQGQLIGFGDPEIVPLPAPFGSRRVLNFESPEYDLLPSLLATESVVVKVGFELSGVNLALACWRRTWPALGRLVMPALGRIGGAASGWGSSGGAVMVELFAADGSVRSGAMVADRDGQQLAALPAAYVAIGLARGESCPAGSVTAYQAIGAQRLLDRLVADGFRFETATRAAVS